MSRKTHCGKKKNVSAFLLADLLTWFQMNRKGNEAIVRLFSLSSTKHISLFMKLFSSLCHLLENVTSLNKRADLTI